MTLKSFLPLIGSLENYSKPQLKGDISAGLTVGVMLIPQGMAYSMLAGLPPIYGLYASTIPLLLYALFGTSRQLAVGPVAMVALLIATGVSTAVRDLTKMAFSEVGIELEFSGSGENEIGVIAKLKNDTTKLEIGQTIVKIDPTYFRPAEVDTLIGDASKAKKMLGWKPKVSLKELVREMVIEDLKTPL